MKRKLIKVSLAVLGLVLAAVAGLYAVGGQTARYQADVEIDAAPETVFEYLTDSELLLQWLEGVTEIKPLTEGGHRVGAKARVTVREGDAAFIMEDEVIRSDAAELLEVRITSSVFEILSTYSLEPRGERTHLVHEMQADYKGFIRILAPLAGPEATRKMNEDFARLKRLVEEHESRSVAPE